MQHLKQEKDHYCITVTENSRPVYVRNRFLSRKSRFIDNLSLNIENRIDISNIERNQFAIKHQSLKDLENGESEFHSITIKASETSLWKILIPSYIFSNLEYSFLYLLFFLFICLCFLIFLK